ncbi:MULTISPECIES: hypothetical protein [unclassified Sinorhizobium]|uniref:hypothetical protein n=1 Tax=unclassified Sinorhizobium TaxID=2613772 RepID=UPI0035255705
MNGFLLDAPFGTEAEGTIQSGFIRGDRRPLLAASKFDAPSSFSVGHFHVPQQMRFAGDCNPAATFNAYMSEIPAGQIIEGTYYLRGTSQRADVFLLLCEGQQRQAGGAHPVRSSPVG